MNIFPDPDFALDSFRARHEVAFPLHEYPVRVRRSDTGTVDAHVLHTPVTPRLWTYTMVLPSGPWSAL